MSPPRFYSPHQPRGSPSLSFFEQISLKDIKEGQLNNKITKIIETITLSLSDNEDNYVSLKLFANVFKGTPNKSVVNEADKQDLKEVVQELEEALKKHLDNKQKVLSERPERLKKLRESKNKKVDDVEQEVEPTLETPLKDSMIKDNSKKRMKSENSENSYSEEPVPKKKKKKGKQEDIYIPIAEMSVSQDETGATTKSKKKKQK